MKRVLTEYTFRTDKIDRPLRLAVASDIHSSPFEDVMEEFTRCDAVLIPGDLVDRHRRNNENAYRFLEAAPECAPVFYSIGNHERKFRDRENYLRKVRESKVVLLDNESVSFEGIRIGGLSSVKEKQPDLEFLNRFEKEEGYRLLLCHHPEVYRDFVSGRDIDLTLSGHAHGGQIQIGGRGLYAPGQGLFPKLTHGLYDGGKLLVSRGMTNGAKPRIPRIGNPCELIILNLINKSDTDSNTKNE
ncbi:MAG: metallophosphoesterase [Clostridia bacterium]|nr:metallophosphoesterase [Clostridia bacterium]